MDWIIFNCEYSAEIVEIATTFLLCFLGLIAVIGSALCFEAMNETLFVGVVLTIIFTLSFKPFNNYILVGLLLYFDFRGHNNLNLIYNLILCSYFNIMIGNYYSWEALHEIEMNKVIIKLWVWILCERFGRTRLRFVSLRILCRLVFLWAFLSQTEHSGYFHQKLMPIFSCFHLQDKFS